jgi:outer membrane protein
MLKSMKVSLALLAATFSFLAFSNAAVADGKIAVVNIEKAIFETEVAKSQMKKMQSIPDYKSGTKTLQKLSGEAKGLEEKFKKDGATMSAADKEKLQNEFKGKLADIQYEENKLKKMGQEIYGKVLRDMEPKVREVMAVVVKEQKIGLLLDRQAAIHVDASFDITSLITQRLNEAN